MAQKSPVRKALKHASTGLPTSHQEYQLLISQSLLFAVWTNSKIQSKTQLLKQPLFKFKMPFCQHFLSTAKTFNVLVTKPQLLHDRGMGVQDLPKVRSLTAQIQLLPQLCSDQWMVFFFNFTCQNITSIVQVMEQKAGTGLHGFKDTCLQNTQ